MLLALLRPALACLPDYGLGLVDGDYPVDAPLLLVGLGVEEVHVYDEGGAEVDVTLREECFDADNNVPGGCRYTLAPPGEWAPGATYTVWASFRYYSDVRESTFQAHIAADGRRVEPVTGEPDLVVEGFPVEADHNSCEPADPERYVVTVTPAAPGDAQGLSFLRLTRTDGYMRALAVPEDGALFVRELLASGAAEDCFTLVQVDGAGNESAAVEACVDPVPAEEAAACGCGSEAAPAWLALVAGLLVAGRRVRSRAGVRSLLALPAPASAPPPAW